MKREGGGGVGTSSEALCQSGPPYAPYTARCHGELLQAGEALHNLHNSNGLCDTQAAEKCAGEDLC